jgi:alkylation response protein AidB-like acyl-CoA dehydrogenase
MEFSFPPDSLMLRDMLRRFIEKEAQPLEMKYFNQGSLEPKEVAHLRKLIDQMGLWGIFVPEAFGGGGLDMVTACLLEEELGKTFIPLDLGEVPPMLYACRGEQVKHFLEPALAGERRPFLAVRELDALRPEDWRTWAEKQGNSFMLHGSKLISGKPTTSDFLVVFAKTKDGSSEIQVRSEANTAGFSIFMLDTDHPGLSFYKKDPVVVQFNNCVVGPDALLGEIGQAFSLGAEDAPRTWIRLGARFVGLADRLVALAAKYARDWVALGAPLMDRPAIKQLLAEIKVQVNCARWLVYHAAWQADQDSPVRILAAEVRFTTGEMLQKVKDLAIMVYGGPGPAPEPDLSFFSSSIIPMEMFKLGAEGARNMIAADILKVNG